MPEHREPDSARADQQAHPSRTFPRQRRVTRGPEIEAVQHGGKRLRIGALETRAIASPHALGRVGFIVPKYKHGTVERNRLKRQLRELVRLDVLPALGAVDLVIRALPRAYTCDFETLRGDVHRMQRALERERERTRDGDRNGDRNGAQHGDRLTPTPPPAP